MQIFKKKFKKVIHRITGSTMISHKLDGLSKELQDIKNVSCRGCNSTPSASAFNRLRKVYDALQDEESQSLFWGYLQRRVALRDYPLYELHLTHK